MHCVAMPGARHSEISYRVKCVVVESERVFGDMLVTQQTRNRPYWVNTCHYPKLSRRKLYNLTKEIFETPDLMTLNRKSVSRKLHVEVTTILPISDDNSEKKQKHVSALTGKVLGAIDAHFELEKTLKSYPLPVLKESTSQEAVVTSLVDQLLLDIYGYPRSDRGRSESDSTASSYKPPPQRRYLRRARLLRKTKEELTVVLQTLREHINHAGGLLVRQLRRRDYLLAKRDKQYDVITAYLQAYSAKRSEDTRMRFTLTPQPGDSGFAQWLDAMKMVARLQGGIPQEFRKRLWLTLAERHLEQRGVDWKQAEKLCFNEWSNPDDEELGIQIVKDLHRTGCSLFCGAAGRDNQAVLRRVLLGFARWNKSVGYCQGLNVLAALVLQVTDRAEASAVKVMIYLIEGVLPEGYFADNLRGLSIDMAVFRDLLRIRLPKLSRHLEALQSDVKDKATGSSYEPPLTNVFTMQWFLTLFCHCLPQEAVLRVWDLIFLEGDEVLLRTALAIWEGISDRIMTVTSADEFYSIMGVLTREMLEFTDVNNLIKTIVNMGPLYGVTDLREKHRYNITPWARRLSDEEDTDTEEEERLAVAAAMFGVSQRFRKDRATVSSALQTIGPSSDRERLALDISTLKHQYAKLRERQRQAHIILSAACARQSMVPSSTPQAMNHLLVGKSALVSAKTRQLGPPPGAIPPKPRTSQLHSPRIQSRRDKQAVTLHWKDTKKPKETKDEPAVGDGGDSTTSLVHSPEVMSITLTSPKRAGATDSDSDSTSTELCDEPDRLSDVDSEEPTSTSDCYVMATDDEKSPRPGVSPVSGCTPVRQSLEHQVMTKRDTLCLQVQQYRPDTIDSNDYQHQDLLDVDESSYSIARITDQIRRLSASDDINSSVTQKDIKSVTDDADELETMKVKVSPNMFGKDISIDEEHSNEDKVEIRGESQETIQTSHLASEDNFTKLDSFDFVSSSNMSSGDIKTIDTIVSLEDKHHKNVVDEVCTVAKINSPAVSDAPSELGSSKSIASRESIQLLEFDSQRFKINETLISDNISTNVNYEKKTPESTDITFSKSTMYLNNPGITGSSMTDELHSVVDDRMFYSRSYVIGHIPISPTTVNEKLSKSAEFSPMSDNASIFIKGITSYANNPRTSIDTNYDSLAEKTEAKPDILSSTLVRNVLLNDSAQKSSNEICKNSSVTHMSSPLTNADNPNEDPLFLYESFKKPSEDVRGLDNQETIASFKTETKNVSTDNTTALSLLADGTSKPIDKCEISDYQFTLKTDPDLTKSFISSLRDAKNGTNEERKAENNLKSIDMNVDNTLKKPSGFYDYSSTKTFDEKKKSPKTPDSTKSFSSGETMGPDSKTSSLATSPRTPNRCESRNFVIDKSEPSSVSSDSKTLTLQSLGLEVGENRAKLNMKSDILRPSLDESSPSTPISSDSLKNKSEISPKFIISSSSESCSPGKAKSSERSFSSELQSPISANSIKYRTTYVEGQDNLSESPMDVCSATSPFYPIVYPSQKTPSPYGTTGKQRNSTDSTETSPEQKSSSSKEEKNSVKYNVEYIPSKVSKPNHAAKSSKSKDDYDSARPFEKELEDTLSALPSDTSRKKNDSISTLYKEDRELSTYRNKNNILEEKNQERYLETDTISPLPRDKYDNWSAFVDKPGNFKGIGVNGKDHNYSSDSKESFKRFERSCSSLEKRLTDMKGSSSSDEIGANTHKKRSSDILQDLRHLEAKTSNDGVADASMLTRKTGYDWEDLKNLEARRQDNFSDSAREFSRGRLNIPSINVFGETRKSYVVEPKINLEEGSDSILKNYARTKSNGEPDDDRESKLGVWTKVKPRKSRDNGRRSSDRALKIIQENSAILHKILTCQAKKRLPDLEEISKEITISPINEEISKIFSPILEKMGLNEHEINEELARINFKDFDQMTATSGSEFDAKINEELSKLSLIDDNEEIDQLDVDEVISRDYLNTREALIDKQINEELSKLLANYEESSPVCIINRDGASSGQNPSDIEGLEISSISTNVFSYQSSNDSIETKSELGSIQDSVIQTDKFAPYSENVMSFAQTPKYSLRSLSPKSDIDIYRELEKLDKISSGEILPSASASVSQKIISPISYTTECPLYTDVRPSSLEYCIKPEKSFDPSPMKSPYDTYKPYDFKSRISPRKTPSNPYSARSYDKSGADTSFDFHDKVTTPSRLYDLGASRPILSKETLEFRVRYDDDSFKQIRDDDLSLEPYQTNLVDLDRGASYYSNESTISLQRLTTDKERSLQQSETSPLDYSYNQTELYPNKYDTLSPKNYSYAKTTTEYDKQPFKFDEEFEAGSYLPLRRKNSHSLSPNYQYGDREFAASMNPYASELSPSLDEASKRPVSHPEFVEKMNVVKYSDVSSTNSLSYRKASLSLGPLENTTNRTSSGIDTTMSPKSTFSPFPVRNAPRKPKELALKLGLYSPSSPGSTPLKRS